MDRKKKIGIGIAAALLILTAGVLIWHLSSGDGGKAPGDNPGTEEVSPEEKDEEPEAEENSDGKDEETPQAEDGESTEGSGSSGSSQNMSDPYPRPEGVSVVSNPDSITALVNKSNFLPDDWQPSDLVSVGGGQSLRAEAAAAFEELKKAAEADGYTFNVISGYRTKATQISLYSNYMAQDPEGAPYLSAYPRSSEHELGLAMDISPDWSLHYDLLETGLGKWMTAHAHEYGWILRYPEGKTNVTGYVFEAWHYRYLGKDLAAKVKNSGLTLEEYYGSV